MNHPRHHVQWDAHGARRAWCPLCWLTGIGLFRPPESGSLTALEIGDSATPFTGTSAFKLVRRIRPDELWSYMAYVIDDDDTPASDHWQRRYFPGHVTRPAVGMLFVFDSLAHARQYNEQTGRQKCEIWEADIQGAERLAAASYAHAKEFWDGSRCKIVPVPKGTLVCNTVTLRQRVA